jgi:short-subunit dehydrogenase
MADRGTGRIVATSSVNGRIGIPWRSAYCASKHAMHGWFESLRAELAGSGVGVTIICPGYVRTGISRNSLLADGSAYGTVAPEHAGGMDADVFARRALRAIRRGRPEAHIGAPETWGIQLFRFAPNLFRRLVRGYGHPPAAV